VDHFQTDLKTYLRYRKQCDGVTLTPSTVDFEDFLGFLDVEHHLGLRGKDDRAVELLFHRA